MTPRDLENAVYELKDAVEAALTAVYSLAAKVDSLDTVEQKVWSASRSLDRIDG